MPINISISTMSANDVLSKEAVLALQSSTSPVIFPHREIVPTAPPVIIEEPKAFDKLKTVFLKKPAVKPVPPVLTPVIFDALLIKTAENTWHVIEDAALGAGGFGAVKRAMRKIVIDGNGVGRCMPADDVVKILKLPVNFQERATLIRDVDREHARLDENDLAICPPIMDDQNLYLLMSNCGPSLDKCMPEKTHFDFDVSFQIAHGLLNNMFTLKMQDTIHRDIKPANICRKEIIGRNGHIYHQYIFIDFGVALKTNAPVQDIVGTLNYMAPESLLGQVSLASDVYALAGLFLEIFGAEDAFLNKNAALNNHATIRAPYSIVNLFGKHLPSNCIHIPADVDGRLLSNLESLFAQMGDPNPANRPSIDYILKFFNGIPYRREINKRIVDEQGKLNAKVLEKNNLIDSALSLIDVFGISHVSFGFVKSIKGEKSVVINSLLGSHMNATTRVIANGRTVADMYPDINYNTQQPINEIEAEITTIQAIKNRLDSIKTIYDKIVLQFTTNNTFRGTNSSGVKLINKILQDNDKTILQKLSEISTIAKDKTANTFSNNFRRSKCCLFNKKGRHENIELLYKQLAKISLPESLSTVTQENISNMLDTQLQEVDALFQAQTSFTYAHVA